MSRGKRSRKIKSKNKTIKALIKAFSIMHTTIMQVAAELNNIRLAAGYVKGGIVPQPPKDKDHVSISINQEQEVLDESQQAKLHELLNNDNVRVL